MANYNYDYLLAMSSMTASQFKTFKKALNILIRAGMAREDAVNTIVYAFTTKKQMAA